MIYDLIIIGMGPAGVTAAIYAKRAGLNVLCLDKSMIGGYINFIDKIDNYPGLYNVSGPDLAFKLYEHIKGLDIEFKNKAVLNVVDGKVKKVVTDNEEILCKYVIIATGREPRKLGLEYEKELLGKGISHCALCDGSLYKDREVAVVGGGNSALGEALYLANICKKVYLIHRREDFKITGEIVDKVKVVNNIEKVMNSKIVKLNIDNDKFSGVTLDNGKIINVDCLFSYVGYVPGTKFAVSLGITDEEGYILVDKNYETKIKNIYAVGDIIKKDMYQIVNATTEGAIAADQVIKKCINS